MSKLAPNDLFSLEEYSKVRTDFRARVLQHKRHRRLSLGEHVTLQFEDALTMQYQVQEMLRIERIFEAQGIADELAAYNPLIPDGMNWKATMLIEYTEVAERQTALARLVGIEDTVWVQVDEFEPVYAVADEDMDRSTPDKTSAVHFLRFELTGPMIAALRNGSGLQVGVSHPACDLNGVTVTELLRESLIADLN